MPRLEVSGAVRPIYGSLGVKRLINAFTGERNFNIFYTLHVLSKDIRAFKLKFNTEIKSVSIIVLLYLNNIIKGGGTDRETYK